jgi:hypothetical protein
MVRTVQTKTVVYSPLLFTASIHFDPIANIVTLLNELCHQSIRFYWYFLPRSFPVRFCYLTVQGSYVKILLIRNEHSSVNMTAF